MLLGVVALAAGLKKAIGDPYDPLGGWIAVGLAAGAALFILCEVGFRWTFGIPGTGSGSLQLRRCSQRCRSAPS